MKNDVFVPKSKIQRLMLDFLIMKGWLPSQLQLSNLIEEYRLEDEFEEYKKKNW